MKTLKEKIRKERGHERERNFVCNINVVDIFIIPVVVTDYKFLPRVALAMLLLVPCSQNRKKLHPVQLHSILTILYNNNWIVSSKTTRCVSLHIFPYK
jgi:hypothetical protein